jgi:hypothetical protein
MDISAQHLDQKTTNAEEGAFSQNEKKQGLGSKI